MSSSSRALFAAFILSHVHPPSRQTSHEGPSDVSAPATIVPRHGGAARPFDAIHTWTSGSRPSRGTGHRQYGQQEQGVRLRTVRAQRTEDQPHHPDTLTDQDDHGKTGRS
jgi:hypothetical protein